MNKKFTYLTKKPELKSMLETMLNEEFTFSKKLKVDCISSDRELTENEYKIMAIIVELDEINMCQNVIKAIIQVDNEYEEMENSFMLLKKIGFTSLRDEDIKNNLKDVNYNGDSFHYQKLISIMKDLLSKDIILESFYRSTINLIKDDIQMIS